jgi:uncharacterized membrane protein
MQLLLMKKLTTLFLLLIYIQLSTQLKTLYRAAITNSQIENLAKRLGMYTYDIQTNLFTHKYAKIYICIHIYLYICMYVYTEGEFGEKLERFATTFEHM